MPQHSSAGKERIGRISKMGNPSLRSLLVAGAIAVITHARRRAACRRGARAEAVDGGRRPRQKDGADRMGLLAKGGVYNRGLPAMSATV